MNWHGLIQSVAAAATAIGVFIAVWQLWATRVQARTNFEDGLAREYRDLIQTIPVKAMLGQTLTDAEMAASLPAFYRYFDLSNEQAFLRQNRRVGSATWNDWADGIRGNLRRAAFVHAWHYIQTSAEGSFGELRRLKTCDFREDPRRWSKAEQHAPQADTGLATNVAAPESN